MASDQEYATYSETGETFKDKGCQVLSLSLEEERGGWKVVEERGRGERGERRIPGTPEQAQDAAGLEPAVPGDARAVPAADSPPRRRVRAANYFIITLCKDPARSPSPALSVYVRTMGILRKIAKKKNFKKSLAALWGLCCVCVPAMPAMHPNPYRRNSEISPFNLIWSHQHVL